MTIDVRSVAIRFADLWAVDPHQMVEEIYACDIEMENMTNPALVIIGSAQLHAVEVRLTELIPEHRHELIRVIADRNVACLETTIVSPTTHEYAPACLWWWLDDTGVVAAETGWFNWDDRTADSRTSHGTVPPRGRATTGHDRSWHQTMARRYVQGWMHDPVGSVTDLFAQDCTFGLVGKQELRGYDDLRRTRQLAVDEMPGLTRSMELYRVIGEGSVVAVLVTIGDTTHVSRGTVVLTFDDDDRIVSERSYLDWRRRVPRSGVGTRRPIGSPGWIVRG